MELEGRKDKWGPGGGWGYTGGGGWEAREQERGACSEFGVCSWLLGVGSAYTTRVVITSIIMGFGFYKQKGK